jgi:hypothetical protein
MHEETWWAIFSDPNHIIAELLWNIIQDGVVIFLGYKLFWKKYVYPKMHARFDKEHGLEHKKEAGA